MFSSQSQHMQLSTLPAVEDPYKESEMVFVVLFSPEAGLRVLVRVPLNKPGDSSNKKLYLKWVLNKKSG